MFKINMRLSDALLLAGVGFAASGLAALLVSALKITDEITLGLISWLVPFFVGYWCCSRDRRLEREREISHAKLENLLKGWRRR